MKGFDESYEGHGLEDSDFVLRLLRSGLKRKNVEYCSPVLHLFHDRKIAQRHEGANNNGKLFNEMLLADTERFLPLTATKDPAHKPEKVLEAGE